MIGAAGLERFARYAAPPNRLGYCGPAEFDSSPHFDDERRGELRRSAREFIGAYPYLELLAGAADLDDPLADGPVEAYWIGNPIVQRVAVGNFGRSLDDRFRRRSGDAWQHVELAVPGALCNHAFHVFVVSPWVGLMRDGAVDEPLSIVDDCRVSWGTVMSTMAGFVVVERTPLVWEDGRLVPGAAEVVTVRCDVDVAAVVGDVVSIHWGNVCDVLTTSQFAWLRHVTNSQLALSAAIGRPC
ncbi:MAG: hypothetical protein ACI9N0_000566 [Ilumatobacter sp.]|jgi:hypothetical protein